VPEERGVVAFRVAEAEPEIEGKVEPEAGEEVMLTDAPGDRLTTDEGDVGINVGAEVTLPLAVDKKVVELPVATGMLLLPLTG